MGKPFFDVFPSLKLSGSVRDIMEQTTVEKISATKRKDYLRIYILSERLILKEDIWGSEYKRTRKLFRRTASANSHRGKRQADYGSSTPYCQ